MTLIMPDVSPTSLPAYGHRTVAVTLPRRPVTVADAFPAYGAAIDLLRTRGGVTELRAIAKAGESL